MSRKVLIIDDDPKLNRLLTEFLSGLGYTVHAALSPSERLQQTARHRPDILILDVMLPEMNGFDVCRKIRLDSSIPSSC
jgi:two-component system phosphate regulon response regulator OmpR